MQARDTARPFDRSARTSRHEARDSKLDPTTLRSRVAAIRSEWSEAERCRRANTARAVQWLLFSPPVGFRLTAE